MFNNPNYLKNTHFADKSTDVDTELYSIFNEAVNSSEWVDVYNGVTWPTESSLAGQSNLDMGDTGLGFLSSPNVQKESAAARVFQYDQFEYLTHLQLLKTRISHLLQQRFVVDRPQFDLEFLEQSFINTGVDLVNNFPCDQLMLLKMILASIRTVGVVQSESEILTSYRQKLSEKLMHAMGIGHLTCALDFMMPYHQTDVEVSELTYFVSRTQGINSGCVNHRMTPGSSSFFNRASMSTPQNKTMQGIEKNNHKA